MPHPQTGCGGQAAHDCPLTEDGACPEEPDSGDDLGGDPGLIGGFETDYGGEREDGGTDSHQGMSAQAGSLAGRFPFVTDQPTAYGREKQAPENRTRFHSSSFRGALRIPNAIGSGGSRAG